MFESDSARYAVYYAAALRGLCPSDQITPHYLNHVAWHLYEIHNVYPTRLLLFLAGLRIGFRDPAPVRERMVGWWELRERFTFGSSP